VEHKRRNPEILSRFSVKNSTHSSCGCRAWLVDHWDAGAEGPVCQSNPVEDILVMEQP